MKKTFTVLRSNDLRSSFIGRAPVDYTPFRGAEAADGVSKGRSVIGRGDIQ
jgi:hypothetical protein